MIPAMWCWTRYIPRQTEQEWMRRLADVPNCVFSTTPGRQRARIDCYARQPAPLVALVAAYGGKLSRVEERDWVAAAAPSRIPPLLIRDRLVVCASEENAAAMRERYPRRCVLHFPAESAFGTGHHATTATCLRLLCDEAGRRRGTAWRMIDVGCGTGILAIAALRLGASSALAFDFDPAAVDIARRNAERNGGTSGLSLLRADVLTQPPSPEQRAHVVTANLFSEVLRRAFPQLREYFLPGGGGVLIISGILRDQADETLASALSAGFSLSRTVVRSKWVTMQLST